MDAGPVLIVEPVPSAASAAVGAWIRSGSAHEPEEQAGITHLLEHLLLRRCGDRSPEAIAELIDSLGGDVDAFTTREVCAITAHVPAQRLEEGLALVMDAIARPRLFPEEFATEQGVVAAEFDLVQDSPAEVAAERALLACWGSHALARPVLGSRDVVRRLRPEDLAQFHRARFTRDRLLLVVSGPVRPDLVNPYLEALPFGPSENSENIELTRPVWHPGVVLEQRDGLEQLYASLVLPGLPSGSSEMFALGVLQQLLGAGASSRLFRELRDRLGLVYDVESTIYSTAAAGVLEVTFSSPIRQAETCWRAVLRVLDEVAAGRISDGEVELARQAIASGVVLGAEGVDALMEAHAGEFLARGRRFDAAQVLGELAAVTPDQVRALARRIVRLDQLAGAVCGPHDAALAPSQLVRRVA